MKESQFANTMKLAKLILKFLGRRNIFWLTVALVTGVSMSVVELSIPALMQQFMSKFGFASMDTSSMPILQKIHPTLPMLLILLLIAGCARSFLLFIGQQSNSITNELIATRLKTLAVYRLLGEDSKTYVSSSKMNYYMNEIVARAANFAFHLFAGLSNGIQAASFFAIMLYLAWRETLVGFAGLLLIAGAVLAIGRRVNLVASRVPAEQVALQSGIQRVTRNWLLVKVLRQSRSEYKRMLANIVNAHNHVLRANSYALFGGVLPQMLGVFLLVLIMYISYTFWHTPGFQFISFLYLFIRFTQTLSTIATSYGLCNSVQTHFMQALGFFDEFTPAERRDALVHTNRISWIGTGRVEADDFEATLNSLSPRRIIAHDAALKVAPPSIAVENVSFTYPSSQTQLFRNFSLSIPAGSQFAIVGPSGSGKSTLLGIVLGLFKPGTGTISIGNQTPEMFFDNLNNGVGYVGPEAFLVEGTLRDNLCYGASRRHTDEDMMKALDAARLTALVKSLPDGLGYHIKENGDGLSAGQKQRLALARALLGKPVLLILDEVSANLDEGTESEIAESLRECKGTMTTILVSHRQGILKYADSIFSLNPN